MLVGSDKLKCDTLSDEESGESERRFVVENEVLHGKELGFKEGKDFLEGRDVRLRRPGFERLVTDVTMVESDKEVFMAMERGDRKTSGKISRRPFRAMDGAD
jgi:hypothetical protein